MIKKLLSFGLLEYLIYENNLLEIKLIEKEDFPYLFLHVSNKGDLNQSLCIQVELKVKNNLATVDSKEINIHNNAIFSSLHLSLEKSQSLEDLDFTVYIDGLSKHTYKKQFIVQSYLKPHLRERTL